MSLIQSQYPEHIPDSQPLLVATILYGLGRPKDLDIFSLDCMPTFLDDADDELDNILSKTRRRRHPALTKLTEKLSQARRICAVPSSVLLAFNDHANSCIQILTSAQQDLSAADQTLSDLWSPAGYVDLFLSWYEELSLAKALLSLCNIDHRSCIHLNWIRSHSSVLTHTPIQYLL